MKKLVFILVFVLTCSLFLIPSFAHSGQLSGIIFEYNENGQTYFYAVILDSIPTPIVYTDSWINYRGRDLRNDNFTTFSEAQQFINDGMYDLIINYPDVGSPVDDYGVTNLSKFVQYWNVGSVDNQTNYIPGVIPGNQPEEPIFGDASQWISDMWDWVLWQLGINDDYSGDIDTWITGGDRERISLVTPTPSPDPPTPTTYTLDIMDPNTGQPVYEITGIPGGTTIINGGDTYNGSDFDIFGVDIQIGDGGSSNPKDGLNSVMDSNLEYLKDIDTTPVSTSFGIIPNDWFLMIGVLAALPFIAGFIMRLLK